MTDYELQCREAFEIAYPHIKNDFGSLFINSYTSLNDQERWKAWQKCWRYLKPEGAVLVAIKVPGVEEHDVDDYITDQLIVDDFQCNANLIDKFEYEIIASRPIKDNKCSG